MKKRYRILIIGILLVLLFRGYLFRTLVRYQENNELEKIPLTNETLRDQIKSIQSQEDIEDLIKIALVLTADHLHFRSQASSVDPNQLFRPTSSPTHCVGYSAFFATIFQQLLQQHNWQDSYQVQHLRGHLTLLGFDLHQFNDDPFFQHHDYNRIIEISTGKQWVVDIAVYDYFGIGP